MDTHFLKRGFRLIRKRFLYRSRIFLKYHFTRSKKEPLFVIAAPRTGSNLLLSYLNSIPGVNMLPEALNDSMFYGLRKKRISKAAVLRHLSYTVHSGEGRICGTKLIRSQMEAHRLTPGDLKKKFPRAKFIILYRRALLEQYVSLRIAETTHAWTWSEGCQIPGRMILDPESFKKFTSDTRRFYGRILEDPALVERSCVISYEEMMGNTQKVLNDKVFTLLGLKPAAVSSSMKKQNTRSVAEIIENYGDFLSLNSRFALLGNGHAG